MQLTLLARPWLRPMGQHGYSVRERRCWNVKPSGPADDENTYARLQAEARTRTSLDARTTCLLLLIIVNTIIIIALGLLVCLLLHYLLVKLIQLGRRNSHPGAARARSMKELWHARWMVTAKNAAASRGGGQGGSVVYKSSLQKGSIFWENMFPPN